MVSKVNSEVASYCVVCVSQNEDMDEDDYDDDEDIGMQEGEEEEEQDVVILGVCLMKYSQHFFLQSFILIIAYVSV